MKNVLILNKYSSTSLPYKDFLNDFDGNIVLFTTTETVNEFREQGFFAEVIGFDSFRESILIEFLALKYHEKYNFENVVVTGESEIITGANVRKMLGLEHVGQSIESSLVFRDKLLMKKVLEGKLTSLRLPNYLAIHSLSDVLTFAKTNGYPFVLKARKSMASQNVYVMNDESDIAEFATVVKNHEITDFICEEFIDLPQFIFDGKVQDGKLKAYTMSWYQRNPLDLAKDKDAKGMIINYNSTPKISKLNDQRMNEIFSNLPFPNNSLFHCEVFYDVNTDEMIFAEIGSRSGGATLPKAFKQATNINHLQDYIRKELNLSVDSQKYSQNYTSMIMPYYHSGTVQSLPSYDKVKELFGDYFVDIDTFIKLGATYSDDLKSTKFAASIIVNIPSSEDVDQTSQKLLELYNDYLVIK